MATPPHLPPLDARFEVEPAKKPGSWYWPLNGIRYQVQDGDTIANIASRSGHGAKYIMDYAFGTHDPREVNWHLRNTVGCKKYGPAGQNFAFSKSADPGWIWLPRQAYVQLTKKPMPSAHRYDIPGTLPRYRQYGSTSNCCWAVAGANMRDWKKGKKRAVRDAVADIGTEWADKFDANDYLTGPDFERFAKAAGMRPLRLGDFLSDHYWMETIRSRGALMMLQTAYDDWTHWVMVTGYEVTETGRLRGIYLDPADGSRYSTTADALYESCIDARTKAAKVWSF